MEASEVKKKKADEGKDLASGTLGTSALPPTSGSPSAQNKKQKRKYYFDESLSAVF